MYAIVSKRSFITPFKDCTFQRETPFVRKYYM